MHTLCKNPLQAFLQMRIVNFAVVDFAMLPF